MSNFSFFRHLGGGSGIIRAEQMAKFLGGRVNPEKDFENDICIYVKMEPPPNFPKNSYLDVLDTKDRVIWLGKHPEIGIIAASKYSYNYLSRVLGRKDIVFIPQHHCNFERFKRKRQKVSVAGVIGRPDSMEYPLEDLKKRLAEIGVEFVIKTNYKLKRENVTDFYKNIDVQLIWRKSYARGGRNQKVGYFKNPLKIYNACSFGIPTVCYPEENYVEECSGYFLPAYSIEELVMGVKKLKESKDLYQKYCQKGILKAEEFHIENIAKLYKKLKNET